MFYYVSDSKLFRTDFTLGTENIPLPNKIKFLTFSIGSIFVIDEENYLWSGGYFNTNGNLGLSDMYPRECLYKVPCDTKFFHVSCQSEYTISIDLDGNLWVCGKLPLSNVCIKVFKKISTDKIFIRISCATDYFLCLDIGGNLWVMGKFLGTSFDSLTIIEKNTKYNKIYAFSDLSLAIDHELNLWGCGSTNKFFGGRSVTKFTRLLEEYNIDSLTYTPYYCMVLKIDGNISLYFGSNCQHFTERKITDILSSPMVSPPWSYNTILRDEHGVICCLIKCEDDNYIINDICCHLPIGTKERVFCDYLPNGILYKKSNVKSAMKTS